MIHFPIIEIFTSIQGEGMYAGKLSVFVRVSGCNLRCVFKDSICDTPYSSFNPEKYKFTIEDVVREFKDHPSVDHLVITGGEPMLYDVVGFLKELYSHIPELKYKLCVTVETNGTIMPSEDVMDLITLWSLSPKLSTSEMKDLDNLPENVQIENVNVSKSALLRHREIRLNIPALERYLECGNMVQLKFVYSGKESEEEILDILNQINNRIEIDAAKYVYLMPEGADPDKLSKTAQNAADVCIRNGWNYTDRLHIRLWGNTRNK